MQESTGFHIQKEDFREKKKLEIFSYLLVYGHERKDKGEI